MELLKNNFIFLREKSGLNQAQLSLSLNFSRGTWNNYEKGKSTPSLEDFIKISKYFGYTASQLLEQDLKNVHLTENKENSKFAENVHLKVHRNVHLNNDFKLSVVSDDGPEIKASNVLIPITDISVAAGPGQYNSEYIEHLDSLRLPSSLVKKGGTYLCVRIKGASMAPTLLDGGYVVIRHLDKGEWAKMPDECVYVVIEADGSAVLKRVKNRFKQGYIMLSSDNPDQITYSSYRMETKDIAYIWLAELYFATKMPNIHDQYYSRLQKLEDKVDQMVNSIRKINP